jgi:hypothetical protein
MQAMLMSVPEQLKEVSIKSNNHLFFASDYLIAFLK